MAPRIIIQEDEEVDVAGPFQVTHTRLRPGKDKILGVTIVSTHAGDLLAEANKYATGEWKRAHQPVALLEWVRKFQDWRRT